jgi:flagellin
LAVQASNATNTSTDRAALQNEVSALIAEIDRVATQTAFNGTKLLNGGFTGAVFQIGANAGDSITIDSIANSTASNLGNQMTTIITAAGTITEITDLSALAADAIKISTGSVSVGLAAIASASSYQERAGQIVAAINDKTGTTGVFAYINSANSIVLQSETVTAAFIVSGASLSETGVASAAASVTVTGQVLSGLSVEQYGSAQTAIALVDSALNTINTTRATLGAVQSRFESAVASQQTTSENLAASRSRIQDADFASETANLAKAQILQQSGIAMLAQANAIPQNVLALLQ